MEKQGIKELMELLEAIKILTETGMKIGFNFSANVLISELVALGMRFNELKEAFTNIKGILEEGKDLDQEEIITIVNKVFEIVRIIKANLPEKKEEV